MFEELREINKRPSPYAVYTADALWNDPHTSGKMLAFHLDDSINLSSRNKLFIERSVDWIISRFTVTEKTCIADFGCGPGLYATRLAGKKARVTGIDFSERSIRYARNVAEKEGLDIVYHQENYLNFDTETKFDLILMIFCDFCALSPSQRKTMLEKYYRFLKPGGFVLLDVHSLNTFDAITEKAVYEKNQMDHFWSADDYYAFQTTFKYDAEKVTLDKYTIIEKNRTRVVYNWLQHFSRDSLTREFEETGFCVDAIYSDVCGTPFSAGTMDMAIVAQKPKA